MARVGAGPPGRPQLATMATIQITLNGESYTVPEGLTVLQLLESLGLNPDRVAVELDRQILRRPEWAARRLQAGARLEIVHFVGGG